MKEVKFTPVQREIMDAIDKKGEYLWDMNPMKNTKHIQKALKDLVFADLIKKKPTYGNVFIPTSLGKAAIRWNNAVKILNK